METGKITIKEGVLHRDDRPLLCPYQTRILVPGRMSGTAEVNQATCNTSCSLMSISFGSTKQIITLCNGRKIYSEQEQEEKPKSSLLL